MCGVAPRPAARYLSTLVSTHLPEVPRQQDKVTPVTLIPQVTRSVGVSRVRPESQSLANRDVSSPR